MECCRNRGNGCDELFDSNEGGVDTWSPEKKAWCCTHYTNRCPTHAPPPTPGGGCGPMSPPFDCNAGFSNWQAGWWLPKKDWCCRHFEKGCAAAGDCNAGFFNWQARVLQMAGGVVVAEEGLVLQALRKGWRRRRWRPGCSIGKRRGRCRRRTGAASTSERAAPPPVAAARRRRHRTPRHRMPLSMPHMPFEKKPFEKESFEKEPFEREAL